MRWNSVQVPMIYGYIVGILLILSMLFGWKAELRIIILSGIMLGFYIHSNQPSGGSGSSSSSISRNTASRPSR